MSVIIRLQNLPWSANALDIRNFFRGLSIPEGGVHIVGGELGDAFIAFSTDEDARQAMMLGGGKIKEIQVKLHLSSRSEMHKVIETARQTVPLLSLAPAPVVAPAPVQIPVPAAPPAPPPPPVLPAVITPFSAALANNSLNSFGIPGLGNLQEIPQPAVIELPPAHVSPNDNTNLEEEKEDEKIDNKRREKDRRRTRSRSRSRDRERKDRKRDRRDRSRSRDRRRRDRSRSREGRRERKRDRNIRSRSRDRSPSRRSRDRRKSPSHSQEKESPIHDAPLINQLNSFGNPGTLPPQLHQMLQANAMQKIPVPQDSPRFNDPSVSEAISKMQELAKKRNPNAFQGDYNGGKQQQTQGGGGRGGMNRGPSFQRDRRSRFGPEEAARDCCVAIRNAPNHTSYGDVRRFFPFVIDKHGIKMINDSTGRRTGNIFVKFTESRSKQLSMQRKNNDLKGAQVIVEALDDETYESAVDSFLPYRDDNDGEDAGLMLADLQERAQPQPTYTVLKLTDMPHFIKEHDIIKAFNDFSLLSITLNDCRVTRSKMALVQFAKADEARLAFERRERVAFNRRHPTIVPMTDDEFEKEKIALMPKNDIISRPPEEPPQEVAAPRDPRQRRFDNGATQAPSAQGQGPQATPFFVPFGQNFPGGQNPGFPPGGQFPVPQFGGFPGPSNIDPRTAASNWANRPQFPNQIEQMAGPIKKQMEPIHDIDDEPLDCVLMKGLPRDATDRTIVSFLSDTGSVPARIHLMLDTSGLPSGDCFCEFRSTQEARLAAGKHGTNLEGCRVTVDIVPRSVVEEALEGPKLLENSMQEPAMPNGPPQFFDAQMARGGFNNRGFDSGRGFRGRGGFDRGGFNSRGGFDSGRGYRGRGGFDRGSRGGFEGRGRGRGRGGYDHSGRGGYDHSGRGASAPDEHDPALDDFGAPGCVVSMENVPFRATIDEIMQFFSEFELTQDDVIRRYNERGQPTGDARVAFRTPFDAQRAVKTRHMDNIHDRRINLNII